MGDLRKIDARHSELKYPVWRNWVGDLDRSKAQNLDQENVFVFWKNFRTDPFENAPL